MDLFDAQHEALQLMKTHGLIDLAWTFGWDRAVKRFGRCSYKRRQITLSRHLVAMNSEDEVRDTILHEIAHALAPREAGHGPAWRAKAREIGARPERCYTSARVAAPTGKFVLRCTSCGWKRECFKVTRVVRLVRQMEAGALPPGTIYCRRCGKTHGRLTVGVKAA